MAELRLKPGDPVLLPAGRSWKVARIELDGPKDIAWQQGGKPPRLRRVTIVLEDGGSAPVQPDPVDLVAAYAGVLEAGERRTITAQWGGPCRGCGEQIEPGEQIIYSEGEGAWVCSECGSAE